MSENAGVYNWGQLCHETESTYRLIVNYYHRGDALVLEGIHAIGGYNFCLSADIKLHCSHRYELRTVYNQKTVAAAVHAILMAAHQLEDGDELPFYYDLFEKIATTNNIL